MSETNSESVSKVAASPRAYLTRILFERSPMPKWISDAATGRILDANEAAIRHYGWSRDELLAMRLADIEIAHTMPSGGMDGPGEEPYQHATARHRRKSRPPIDVEVTTQPLVYEDRPALLAVIVDVTERNLAERALRESEERFRTLADNIPQLVWMADADGRVFWYNRRWYEYTGTTFEAMVGWGWRKVHHPDHVDRVVERLTRSWDTGEPWQDTFPLRGRDGTYRWFLSRALPIRDAEGRIARWFGTNTDVTEQLEVEEALRLAKEEAEAANRAKSDFLAAMSHELRTPLNAIAGYLDLIDLGLHGPVTAEQHASIERIKRNQEHLLTLINDVLHFAKLEAGRLEFDTRDLEVADAVDAAATMVEPQAQARGIEFTREPCGPELVARGDPERVQQILLNLIGNASKFTEPGGAIVVRCDADTEWVRIHVVDTGRGIPPDRLDAIFDPFVQLDRARHETSRQGVGLGLAISRDLARGMGGEIDVESEPDRGSTFTLRLKRATG